MKKYMFGILAVSTIAAVLIFNVVLAGEWKPVDERGTRVEDDRKVAQNEADILQTKAAQMEVENAEENKEIPIMVTVGNEQFSAYLYDNEASRTLTEQFPITLDMRELNGNEKYYYMDTEFPTDTEDIESIHVGDLMLYGSNCLVLFYEDFNTTYSYTKLGYLEQPEGLEEALGNGNVSVTFETR